MYIYWARIGALECFSFCYKLVESSVSRQIYSILHLVLLTGHHMVHYLKSVSVGEVVKFTPLQGTGTLIGKLLVKGCLIVT